MSWRLTGKGKALFDETEDWVFAKNEDWIFSFSNVCEVLRIQSAMGPKAGLQWKTTTLKIERTGATD